MVLDEHSLKQLAQARVLIVGDSMLDRYWTGEVTRISPEAPVPVVSVTQEEVRLGGAANVAMNIASMNAKPILLSVVGDDEAGRTLAEMLSDSSIESCLQTDDLLQTTVKLRLMSRNQQMVRADFESTPSAAVLDACLASFQSELAKVDVVLVSDYGKGGTRNITAMIAQARAKNVAVYVDPKGSDYAAYRGASMITPNLAEFQQVVGQVYELDEIQAAAKKLMNELDLQACLVTLSERGMLLCRRDATPIHQPTRAREVYDVTGAGDTVIAMMALAHAAHYEDDQALVLATHAAGVVVSKSGTAAAQIDEVLSSMRRT